IGPAKALAGGVGKAFGGALGGFGAGGGEQKPVGGGVESLVLQNRVQERGAPERVERRTVYEAASPVEVASLFPILRYSFLVDTAPLPEGERGRREVAAYVRNLPALRKLI